MIWADDTRQTGYEVTFQLFRISHGDNITTTSSSTRHHRCKPQHSACPMNCSSDDFLSIVMSSQKSYGGLDRVVSEAQSQSQKLAQKLIRAQQLIRKGYVNKITGSMYGRGYGNACWYRHLRYGFLLCEQSPLVLGNKNFTDRISDAVSRGGFPHILPTSIQCHDPLTPIGIASHFWQVNHPIHTPDK